MYAIPTFLNDFNPANLSNPSSLQINSQPVAEGSGGRGEALEYYDIYVCLGKEKNGNAKSGAYFQMAI